MYLQLASGKVFSIIAGENGQYSNPRHGGPWISMEIGYFTSGLKGMYNGSKNLHSIYSCETPEYFWEYADNLESYVHPKFSEVYAYVPSSLISYYINTQGGIESIIFPELDPKSYYLHPYGVETDV